MLIANKPLPLFPLNTVLFPRMTLPLRIFEPRYRQMLADCLDGDPIFGVVLIREGKEVGETAMPHDVGTTARIIAVQKKSISPICPLCSVKRFPCCATKQKCCLS